MNTDPVILEIETAINTSKYLLNELKMAITVAQEIARQDPPVLAPATDVDDLPRALREYENAYIFQDGALCRTLSQAAAAIEALLAKRDQ